MGAPPSYGAGTEPPWQAFNKLLVILTDPRTHLFCLRCVLRTVQWQVNLYFKSLLGCVTKSFSGFNDFVHDWIQNLKGGH